MDKAKEFKMPKVKAQCYRSNLYHEKMVENIALTTLNKIAFKLNNTNNTTANDKNHYRREEDFIKSLENKKNCKIIFNNIY
jgi:hypothetical protein